MRDISRCDHHIGIVDLRVTVADMAVARALRPRLEALASNLFPGVLEQIFDGLSIEDQLLIIDRLDLDLGRVRADRLEEDALAALRSCLTECLTASLARARLGGGADARLMAVPADRIARLEAFLLSGVLPFPHRGAGFDLADEVRDLARQRPAALVAMARAHAQNRRFLERLVLQADRRALTVWLRLLAPGDAAVILALLVDIQLVHRRVRIAALGRLPDGELRHMLWVTTLEFLLRDAGSDFNRRRFLAALIDREAARLGLSLDALLELLAEAVRIAGARSPLRSSLPGTLWALLAERRGTRGAAPVPDWAGGGEVLPPGDRLDTLRDLSVARLAEPLPLSDAQSGPQARRTRRTAAAASIDAERLFAWLDGAAASAVEADAMVALFSQLADGGDPALVAHLKARRGRSRARLRWATILPMPALGRLIHLLAPAEAPSLVDGALLLAAAWRQTSTFGSPRPSPQDIWKLLLDRIAEPRAVSVPKLLDGLISDLAGKDADRSEKVRRRAGKLASDGGHMTLAAALRSGGSTAKPRPDPVARTKPDDKPPEAPKHALYVGNAGLVLLNPFLPTLFERLELLTPGEDDRPAVAPGPPASRAVHLLQYLADGRLDRSEPELVLNKLLCGLPSSEPVARSIAADPSDLAICDDLLRAVIANWPKLSEMTPDALQETFLVREGRLQHGDAKWLLQVQRKTLDVLTDTLPWAFSVVYHRWMAEPIHVTW